MGSCEDKDTSNSSEDKAMRKRVQSAAAKEEVNGFQDVMEKLAKMVGYKIYPAKMTITTITTEAKKEKKNKEEGERTAYARIKRRRDTAKSECIT